MYVPSLLSNQKASQELEKQQCESEDEDARICVKDVVNNEFKYMQESVIFE